MVMEDHGTKQNRLCSRNCFMASSKRSAKKLGLSAVSFMASFVLMQHSCLHSLLHPQNILHMVRPSSSLPTHVSVPPGRREPHCTWQKLALMECFMGCVGHPKWIEAASPDEAALKSSPTSNKPCQDNFSDSNRHLKLA